MAISLRAKPLGGLGWEDAVEPINWSTEWLASLLWVGRVFAFTLIGFTLVVWLLVRRTGWGRQFWRLSRRVLHPAGTRLDQLAADSDRRAVAAADRRRSPDRRRPLLLEQRPVHRAAGARRSLILEVRRDLRRDRHHQRAARPGQLLHRPGADHSLAAVAQPADGRRLAQRFGLSPRPVRSRTGGQSRSAHPAGRHVVRLDVPIAGPGRGVIGGVAGLLHASSSGDCRARSPSAASRSPGRWSSWPTST